MKKLLAAVVATACLFTAVPAFAADAPEILNAQTVGLVKENDDADYWYVDPATAIIPIKHLKYDAKILDVHIKGAKQVKVDSRKTGAYYLNLCVNKYIFVGKKADVKITVKQNDEVYVLKTTLTFKKAASPFALFTISGKLDTELDYIADFTKAFKGFWSVEFKRPKSLDLAYIDIVMAANQKLLGIYGCYGDCEKKLTNHNRYHFADIKKVTVEYETKASFADDYFNGFFKKENNSFKGTKLFPVKKCVELKVVAKGNVDD
jgi:hypothetical protein